MFSGKILKCRIRFLFLAEESQKMFRNYCLLRIFSSHCLMKSFFNEIWCLVTGWKMRMLLYTSIFVASVLQCLKILLTTHF